MIRCFARRVVIENGRATGVEIDPWTGKIQADDRARREVILAASSINSPKLLMMLSGIGPAAHLAEHGIADRRRPALASGQNLQDHLELYIQQACTQPITLFKHWSLCRQSAGRPRMGCCRRTGPGASNQFESGSLPPLETGRRSIRTSSTTSSRSPCAMTGRRRPRAMAFQAHVGPMRSPSTRVTSRYASADPKAITPKILFNYMSHVRGLGRLPSLHPADARDLCAGPAFDPYRGKEIQPGAALQTDDELDGFIREHVESAYHPCGTCRMGRRDDPMAVVDPDARVIGVDGLRVADSSIFPRITNGNLNGPSIMTGEKTADHILGRRLPRSNRQPWINPRWRESDR